MGTTAYKWGGPAGQGSALTFGFPGPSTDFAQTYDDGRTTDVREPSADFKESVRDALQRWSDIADVTFTEVTDNADLRFTVTGSHPAFDPGKQRGEGFGPSPGPRAGDVWFSPAAAEEWDGALMLHEVGHPIFGFTDTSAAAGLGGATLAPEENFRTRTVMSYEVLPGHETGDPPGATRGMADPWPTSPMVLDIQAAQAIYGANEGYRTGDDVYDFDGAPVHRTIWDAGGTDRLDASDQDDPVVIDLRPGTYSDVGAPVQVNLPDGPETLEFTLGIAHGTRIENADGGTADDRIDGNAGANVLRGGPGDDELKGHGGHDVMYGGGLNGADEAADMLHGGAGLDRAVFDAARDGAEVTNDGAERTVAIDGVVDSLVSVERLTFTDGTLAFDTTATGAYRLYEAAFDRVPDAPGLGFWVGQLDAATSLNEMAASLIASPEFQETYGADVDDSAFVDLLYRNIHERAPDTEGERYWLDQLANVSSRADVLARFSDSSENRANTAEAIDDGVWLT